MFAVLFWEKYVNSTRERKVWNDAAVSVPTSCTNYNLHALVPLLYMCVQVACHYAIVDRVHTTLELSEF